MQGTSYMILPKSTQKPMPVNWMTWNYRESTPVDMADYVWHDSVDVVTARVVDSIVRRLQGYVKDDIA